MSRELSRREFVVYGAAGSLAVLAAGSCRTGRAGSAGTASGVPAPVVPPFALAEATIADLQEGMQNGKYTARSLCEYYLARIDELDRSGPALRAVIETNPEALFIAGRLDAERKAKGPRGALHGIPVLVKDNIATADRMATTAGSLALVGARPPEDAFVVRQLRQAGAVIIGKTNLSEWANFRSSSSSSGWSAPGRPPPWARARRRARPRRTPHPRPARGIPLAHPPRAVSRPRARGWPATTCSAISRLRTRSSPRRST